MISAVSWIPKGVLKSVPLEDEPPSKEELEEILKNGLEETVVDDDENEDDDDEENINVDATNQDDEVAHALAAADALGKGSVGADTDSMADALKDLNMDNYDEEDDGIELFGPGLHNVYYPSNDMDPYLKNQGYDSEELEDIMIKPEDSVVICARNEDDYSHLEVWILEESEGDSNSYVHHDIVIPAFPLCLAWLDCPVKGGEKGNFIAVGSMDPAIEIWDLDVMDEVQPSAILGGIIEKKKKKKKGKKKSIKYKEDSHTDAVLGLAWNKEYRNLLASASADKLVKIWDVATGKCSITMDHHTDKVQAVAWNHFVPQVLLSGSFDDSVVLKDGRIPSHTGMRWQLTSDIESLAWDPHSEHSFVVSVEDGMVSGFDVRVTDCKPSFSLHAHDQAVCSVSYLPLVPKTNWSNSGICPTTNLLASHPKILKLEAPRRELCFLCHFQMIARFCWQWVDQRENWSYGICDRMMQFVQNTPSSLKNMNPQDPDKIRIWHRGFFSCSDTS